MQILENVTSALRRRMVSVTPKQPVEQGRAINRWALYKQLCVAKSDFGLNDRCLAVLSSLLSFLPEDQMTTKSHPVVFPSNRQLSLRAHGMPESTLRRHLTSLINAGIIARKDSPNGKRYAHRDGAGAVELAFGFSFAPLIERACEIAQKAEVILAQQRALKMLRDEVSVARRELAAKFETVEQTEAVSSLFSRFRSIVDAIPRRASLTELTAIRAKFVALNAEIANLLEIKDNVPDLSGTAAQIERHYYESLTESLLENKKKEKIDLKPDSSEGPVPLRTQQKSSTQASQAISLDQVLRICPDISEYGANGISTWREFHDATRIVASFLGISPSAFREAQNFMGLEVASTAIAWILQKLSTIKSPGGYLRSLTQKARAGGFSISQLLFSGMNGTGNLAR